MSVATVMHLDGDKDPATSASSAGPSSACRAARPVEQIADRRKQKNEEVAHRRPARWPSEGAVTLNFNQFEVAADGEPRPRAIRGRLRGSRAWISFERAHDVYQPARCWKASSGSAAGGGGIALVVIVAPPRSIGWVRGKPGVK